MSASSIALPQPTPAQLARGIAGAVPADLSKSPLLGILGVITGAGVVTLTSRMISLGLPDLKGHLGFSYDEGAWIGTAFDVGLMFIGPFTVYLGGLMGPRRILLAAATIFTVLCIFLPLIHSYGLLILAHGLGGIGVRHFLSSHAHLRSAQHSSPLPSVHDCSLRLVRGWRCEHRPIALRLVQKSSLLGMDVLEFGGDHAADDAMHLLRHTEISSGERTRRGAKLRGISICECGFCTDFGSVRTGREARLVALRSIHRAFRQRLVPFNVRSRASPARRQSAC